MPSPATPRMLSQAEVADFTYNNYLTLCSLTNKTGTVFDTRTDRNGLASGEESQSLGTFNTTIPDAVGLSDGCTFLFFGGRDGSSAPISGATVNGNSLSITQVYQAVGSSAALGYVSMYYGYIQQIQPRSVTQCGALFPAGSGTNILTAGCVFVVPGKWTPQVQTAGLAGAAKTVSIAENEMVAYSCYNDTDSSGNNITQTAGTLIASAKQNWYDGAQHGLVYRTTAGSVTMTPTSLSSTAYVYSAKLVYG
jgi:hypothetical protein